MAHIPPSPTAILSAAALAASPEERPSNARLIVWMATLALRHPGRCTAVLLLNLLLLAFTLIGLSLTGLVIDVLQHATDPTGHHAPAYPWYLHPPAEWPAFRVVLTISLAMLGVALLRSAVRLLMLTAQGRLVQNILSSLRQQVYKKLQRLSFRFFDANETGSIVNRATGDSVGVATFAQFAIIDTSMLVVALAVYFVYMVQLNWVLAILAVATTPLLIAASVIYTRMVRPAYDQNRKLSDRMLRALTENIQGHHVVKGFALEPEETAKFRQANDEVSAQQRWLFKRNAFYSALMGMLGHINLALVLGVGGAMIIQHRADPNYPFTPGDLIKFIALISLFSTQVNALANIANSLSSSLTAASRVYEVLQAPLEIQNQPKPVALPTVRGEVAFENVSFGYKADEPVLRDITFRAEPGHIVAILGATGSGKSTLLSLIPRFYDPIIGRVLIDGHDARELDVDQLRRSIGLVFQESFLFSNTVAANIGFGAPNATREQIEKAARIAQAHDFIMELANGYDTIIGEQGSSLSGGQRQRLALARAIVLEPPILILDDATAAIDPETEQEIMAAMDNAMQGRTTFVVAHRLSTLRRADTVLVLDHGRIVQRGSHEELVRTDGHYRAVARMQVADLDSQLIIQAKRWMEGQVDTPLLDPDAMG